MKKDKKTLFTILRYQIGSWYENAYGERDSYKKAIEFYASGTEKRANSLLGPLKAKFDKVPPRTVLDVGCGFASIPIFLAWKWPKSKILATDITDSYFSSGLQSAKLAGVENIAFKVNDIGYLQHKGEFDLVISCNMLNFMTSRKMLDEGLMRLAAATKPGGHLICYTPHFWSFREPFTKVPLLHFISPEWQTKIARLIKKRSTMLDVRNPSLFEISNTLLKNDCRLIEVKPANVIPRFRTTHITAWFQKL